MWVERCSWVWMSFTAAIKERKSSRRKSSIVFFIFFLSDAAVEDIPDDNQRKLVKGNRVLPSTAISSFTSALVICQAVKVRSTVWSTDRLTGKSWRTGKKIEKIAQAMFLS